MSIGYVKQLKMRRLLQMTPSKSILTRIIALICACLPLFAASQIKIDKVGDDWDLKIDSAINLIKQTDTNYYKTLIKYCDHIEIWNGPYSTIYSNSIKGTIVISVSDIKLNSLNNLAAVLVHESAHLGFRNAGNKLSEKDEEHFCYVYELAFIRKLPNVEPWLLEHTLRMSNLK
jgi:hypothetical protein